MTQPSKAVRRFERTARALGSCSSRSSRSSGTARSSRITRLLVISVLALAVGVPAGGCTDPVRDQEIEALGPEEPGVQPGENHRPGQPCLHCHSKGGPASDHPFAIGGTIYKTPAFDSEPAADISVQFVDAKGGGPRLIPVTNDVGNFWIPLEDWPDLAFPIRVGIYTDETKGPTQTMKSLIGREGSCNYCHRPNRDPDELEDADIENNKQYVGQIYVQSGG